MNIFRPGLPSLEKAKQESAAGFQALYILMWETTPRGRPPVCHEDRVPEKAMLFDQDEQRLRQTCARFGAGTHVVRDKGLPSQHAAMWGDALARMYAHALGMQMTQETHSPAAGR